MIEITSHSDIANTLADVSRNSSSAFSTDASVRQKAERQNLNFSSENVELHNRPFSMQELKDALHWAHDTSAGPDEIHYQLLKHFPKFSLLLIKSGYLVTWRKAIIIPIPKPGKDPTSPTNYRLIGLTSCIERMFKRRCVWYLEFHNLLINV